MRLYSLESVYPFLFQVITELLAWFAFTGGNDEVYNMYTQFKLTIVALCGKMSANWICEVLLFYVPKMGAESVHKAVFGLTYVLFVAYSTGDAIYQVMAFTRDVFPGLIFSCCCCTNNSAASVQ